MPGAPRITRSWLTVSHIHKAWEDVRIQSRLSWPDMRKVSLCAPSVSPPPPSCWPPSPRSAPRQPKPTSQLLPPGLSFSSATGSGRPVPPRVLVARRSEAATRDLWTQGYIGIVCLLALGLGWVTYEKFGLPSSWWAFVVLAGLGIGAWWLPAPTSDGRSHFTADNVVVLAAVPILGPPGAGLVGLAIGVMARRRIPLERRVFNAAMTASAAMTAGIVYSIVGGSFDLEQARGSGYLLAHVGGPIVIADLFNLGLNAVLISGVLRVSAGVPVQSQLRDMFTSSGPTQFAYGIIASLLVVLWVPAGLGAVAVLVVMAPMLGARWALLLYGEERNARERALGALVTAIETRAPALEGHGARVSDLAARTAQELGLGPQAIADVRTAGLLHDLGRVVVAPGHEGIDAQDGAAVRGASMLQDLPFLAGASAVMEEVARNGSGTTTPSIAADVVRTADDYDLMMHGEGAVGSSEAMTLLKVNGSGPQHERVVAALARAADAQDERRGMVGVSP